MRTSKDSFLKVVKLMTNSSDEYLRIMKEIHQLTTDQNLLCEIELIMDKSKFRQRHVLYDFLCLFDDFQPYRCELLTITESIVLYLSDYGVGSKRIADCLMCSEQSVRSHRKNAHKKVSRKP